MADVLRISVDPTQVRITPGADPVSLSIRVFNGTRIVDEFHVSAVGIGQWLDAAPARVRLFPDAEGSAELKLSIPQARFVPAGIREVGVQVTSVSDPAVTAIERVQVSVAEVVKGESLTLQPQIVHGTESGEMVAVVRNGANTPMRLTLRGEDPEGAVAFRFQPAILDVPPGGQAWARVLIAARPPRAGVELNRQLTVSADGGHGPLSATATFVQEPKVSSASLFLLRLLLTFVGAAGLVVSAFLRWTSSPARFKGIQLRLSDFIDMAFHSTTRKPAPVPHPGIGDILATAGFAAIVLAVLALLGLTTQRGLLTRFAGGIGIVGVVAFLIVLGRAATAPVSFGLGVWAALAGSVVALVGGFLGRKVVQRA
jgi:hypothetical protein